MVIAIDDLTDESARQYLIMYSTDKHLETPLLHSSHISHRLGIDAYLKLEVPAVVASKLMY